MKKVWLFLTSAIMVLMLTFSAIAENGSKASSRLAMDLVMVIDVSNSMGNTRENGGNDRRGFRLDAAAMLLGLCDAEYSRACVLPFAGTIMTKQKYADTLYSVQLNSVSTVREEMINIVNDYRSGSINAPDTDLGGALMTAVEMLENRDETSNAPVIILLTDGQISFNNRSNNASAVIESRNKFYEAINRAVKDGIRIYTVGLRPKNDKLPTEMLEEAAAQTGGVYNEVIDPESIPAVFNSFFANQVGSDVAKLESTVSEEQRGAAITMLSIPNRSVAEANIMLPVGVKYTTKLYGPNGAEKTFDRSHIVRYNTQNSTFIKIVNPSEVGEWMVTYVSNENNRTLPTELGISVIFSYDVVPEFSFSSQAYKTDEITVDIRFKDKEGNYVDDTSLYMGMNNDGQGGIIPTGYLCNAEGQPVHSEPLHFSKQADRFTTSFTLNQLVPGIRQGDYHFVVQFTGDGMDMTAESQSLKIKNRAPSLAEGTEGISWSPVIHDPTAADYQNEKNAEIQLSDYITDVDGEKISYELMSGYEADMIEANLKAGTSILSMKTKNLRGSTTLKIRAFDGDADGETVFDIPVRIDNVRQRMAEDYEVEVNASGNTSAKHEDINVTLTVKEKGEPVQDESILQLIADHTKTIGYQRRLNEETSDVHPFNFSVRDGALTASFQTEDMAGTYSFSGEALVMDDILLKTPLFPEPFTVENMEPRLKDGVAEKKELPARTIHDPSVASDSDYLKKYEETIDLRSVFEDPDGDPLTSNHLQYSVSATDGEGKTIPNNLISLTVDEEKDILHIITDVNGQAVIMITGTDREGASVSQQIKLNVDNRQSYVSDHYQIRVSREGDADTLPLKNSQFTYIARLLDDDRQITDENILKHVDLSGLKVIRGRGDLKEEDVIVFEKEIDQWKGKAKTYPQERSYFVEGVPLVRGVSVRLSAEDPFLLENNAPVAVRGENDASNMVINDVTLPEDIPEGADPHSIDKIPTITIDLESWFRDEDGEKLTFSAELATGSDVVELKTAGKDAIIKPKGITGEASIHVTATDESDGSAETIIPIRITNVETAIANDWKLGFEMVPTEAGKAEAEVGDEVILRGTINTAETPALYGNVYDLVETHLKMEFSESGANGETSSNELEFHQNGNQLETKPFSLNKQEGSYQIAGTAEIKGIALQLDAEKTRLTIGNEIPAVNEGTVIGTEEIPGYPTTFTVHPFLWGKKNEDTFEIDFTQLFSDSANDHLTFHAAVLPQTETETAIESLIEKAKDESSNYVELVEEPNDQSIILKNERPGERKLLLYATDSSDASNGIVYSSTIISQRQEILKLLALILAGILLLIILILTVYWGGYRKAWSVRHGVVDMIVNGTPRIQDIPFPKRGKGEHTLGTLRIKDAAEGEIKRKLDMTGKSFKLRAGSKEDVIVRRIGKLVSDFDVSVDGHNMSGNMKKATWRAGTSMKLTYSKADVVLVIELKRDSGSKNALRSANPSGQAGLSSHAARKSTGSAQEGKGRPVL